MLRHLLETLKLRLALRDHRKMTLNKGQEARMNQVFRIFDVMPTDAELDAIEAFRNLGAQTDFHARLGQAAQLEAHHVPDSYFHYMLNLHNSRSMVPGDLQILEDHGIELVNVGATVKPHYPTQANKIRRLQAAVKQLAFIAGPGFTTDHLIDEGLLQEGDI